MIWKLIRIYVRRGFKSLSGKAPNRFKTLGAAHTAVSALWVKLHDLAVITHKSQKDVMCGRHPRVIRKMVCFRINMLSRQALKPSAYPVINNSGFTFVELALSMALMVMLVLLVLPGCTSGIRQAYLDEARNNLKIIQTALERYAVDHDGCYPQYILGGDISGWDTKTGCETITTRPHFADNLKQTNMKGGGARPPKDPLISGGYLKSYPDNPFMKNFEEKAPTFSGGIEGQAGSGDVRFGFSGMIMGNALDDPRFLWGRYPLYAKPENIRCQPTRMVNTISMSAWMRDFGSLHPKNEINPFYSTGGIPDSNRKGKTIRRWWPGTFFYRASGEMKLRSDYGSENYEKADTLTIWDFDVASFNRYMLGVYADRAYTGLDIIRLTTLDGKAIQNRSGIIHDEYRRSPMADYDESKLVYMSPPEVFGGGGKGIAPMFPYFDENGDFLYGAPDGHPDGILFVLIDGNRSLDEM